MLVVAASRTRGRGRQACGGRLRGRHGRLPEGQAFMKASQRSMRPTGDVRPR